MAVVITQFRQVIDPSGTLVVIEAGLDVPFRFCSVDIHDANGTELMIDFDPDVPFLLIPVCGELNVISESDTLIASTPRDVVVSDGCAAVKVRSNDPAARFIVLSSSPQTMPKNIVHEARVGEFLESARSVGPDKAGTKDEWTAACPFEIKRIYFTHSVDPSMKRGGHAHWALNQILIAAWGKLSLTLEKNDQVVNALLDDPGRGVLITPVTWRDIIFGPSAVLLVLASEPYDESDYIRDRASFEAIQHVGASETTVGGLDVV